MENFILIFHFLIAVVLIGLVLIQQGKGAEAGASFGSGASQTVFGSAGSWNFFSKATAVLSTVFCQSLKRFLSKRCKRLMFLL
jgi:preprotein translocase subunit SecG